MAKRGRPKKKQGDAGGAIKLVRRNRNSGDISPRKRGRPHPDFETGYLDKTGEFRAGNPRGPRPGRRRRRMGRPPMVRAAAGTGDLAAIEAIVRREVDARLSRARTAAITALEAALA